MPVVIGVKSNQQSSNKSVDENGFVNSVGSLVYQIQADSVNDTPETLFETPGLPQVGDSLRDKNVSDVTIREVADGANLYEATVTLDSAAIETQEDPEQQDPEWEWTSKTVMRASRWDVTRTKIQNSVGELLPIEFPYTIPVLHIWHWIKDFDPNIIYDYTNHCNQTEFLGAPFGSVLCNAINDKKAIIDQEEFREVHYFFEFHLETDSDNPGQFLSNTVREVRLLNRATKYLEDTADPIDEAKLWVNNGDSTMTTGDLQNSDGDEGEKWIEGTHAEALRWLTFNRVPFAEFDSLPIDVSVVEVQ